MTQSSVSSRPKVAFLYLGRNPGFGSLVFDLAQAVSRTKLVEAEFLVAAQTDLASRLSDLGARVTMIETFNRRTLHRAVFGAAPARRQIVDSLVSFKPDFVVTLMPHIWSPRISRDIKRRGMFYATVIHDAEPHPGDPTAWATRWLASDSSKADMVITLSRAVTEQLRRRSIKSPDRIVQLFHPDMEDGRRSLCDARMPREPFRVLFFGRIMAYKGLAQLIEATELLREKGIGVQLGVAGEGSLGRLRARLVALNAEIIDRWVPRSELPQLLERYDAMACSHVEASQSGVAALAFAAAMPVIAAPVGGLAEQVIDGLTGVRADAPTAIGFAAAIERMINETGLYPAISQHLAQSTDERSIDRFLALLVRALMARRVS